ncbi:hypothetical protein [Christiangramia forsetii]|uniref:Secreted protein n=2 Tax=Christiangramia forsetii TaxID=411153 RepID=A0M2J3_CHRFK|nr:hypothetical protein [Christiangramia forsetii]GGG38964.1 hypothetical protein GCM10011532_23420 [Christiangramia forsetii]CAL66838.1 secreted protein [Christiangramia forsetii KT0803]
MSFRLTVLFSLIFILSGISQETENNSILNFPGKYQKYDASSIQLNGNLNLNNGIYNGLYNLEDITNGLFLRPETFEISTPNVIMFEIGHTLKYYIGNSDVYILGGQQTIISTRFDGFRSYDFGLNAGLGYDVNKKIQIEGRTFQSLYNTSPDDAFQPIQLTPIQPLSLSFKTKF